MIILLFIVLETKNIKIGNTNNLTNTKLPDHNLSASNSISFIPIILASIILVVILVVIFICFRKRCPSCMPCLLC